MIWKVPLMAVAAVFVLRLTPGYAADAVTVTTEDEKVSYSVGYQVGGDMKRQGVHLSEAALLQGIRDSLNEEAKPLLSLEERMSTLIELKKRIETTQQELEKEDTRKHLEEGTAFLADNAKKKGVVVLPSGLHYKVIKEGKGKKPELNDTITVNYRGTLINGNEFDSTYRQGKPASIRLESVIPGWREALSMMPEGSVWQLFIPPALAFGEQGPLKDRTVIYEVELLSAAAVEKKSP